MLGVSEGLLRIWAAEGIVHKPFRVRKNVVLFDAYTLAADWEPIKAQAKQGFEEPPAKHIPWDDLLPSK